MLGWHTNSDSEHLHKFTLVDHLEYWTPSQHLDHNAAERPHVNCIRVGYSKDNLRRSVESALDVSEAIFKICASGAEVYDFNVAMMGVCEENILRLKITMNDLYLGQVLQTLKHLRGNTAQLPLLHASVLLALDILI